VAAAAQRSLARFLYYLLGLCAAEGRMGLFPSKGPVCLLDIDGTLAITDPLYVKAFQDLMSAEGVEGVDEAWFAQHVAGRVDAAVFRDVLPGTVDEARIAAASKTKDRLFCARLAKDGAALVPGLAAFFAMCRAENIACCAVSNAQRGGCEAVLGYVKKHCPDASTVIRDLVVGAECARAKPHPEPYLVGAARLHVAPARCIVFEDSRTGIRAGVAAGCVVVGLTTSMRAADMLEAGCAVTIDDWTEVTAAFLEGLVG